MPVAPLLADVVRAPCVASVLSLTAPSSIPHAIKVPQPLSSVFCLPRPKSQIPPPPPPPSITTAAALPLPPVPRSMQLAPVAPPSSTSTAKVDVARRILFRTTAVRIIAVSPTLRLDAIVVDNAQADADAAQPEKPIEMEPTVLLRLAGIAVPLGAAAAAAAREALTALVQGRVLHVHVAAYDSPTATCIGTLPEAEHRVLCVLVRRGLLTLDRRTLLLSQDGAAALSAAGREAQLERCGVWSFDSAHAAFSNPLLYGPFEATVLSVPSGAALIVQATIAAPVPLSATSCQGDDSDDTAGALAESVMTMLVRVAFVSDPVDAILDTPASFGAIDIPQAAFFGRSFLRRSLLGQRVTVHPITMSACGTYLVAEVFAADAAFSAAEKCGCSDRCGAADVAERLLLEGCVTVAHPLPVHLPYRSFVVPPPPRIVAAASLAPLRPPAPPVTVYRPPRDADALRALLPNLTFFRPQRATIEAVADDWSAIALLLHDGTTQVLVPARLAGVATLATPAAATVAHAMRERRAVVFVIALDEDAALFECVIASIEDAPGLLADFTAFASTEAAYNDMMDFNSDDDADAQQQQEANLELTEQMKDQLHDVLERATACSLNAAALSDGWGTPSGCGRIVHDAFPESRCVARALTDAYAPRLRRAVRSPEDTADGEEPAALSLFGAPADALAAAADVTVIRVADDATVTVQLEDEELRAALSTLEKAPLSCVLDSETNVCSTSDDGLPHFGLARHVTVDEWLLHRGVDGALQRVQVAAVTADGVVARPLDATGGCITVNDATALLRSQIARGTDCRTLPVGLGAAMEKIRLAPPLLQDVALAFVRVNPNAAATPSAALAPARLVASVLQAGERVRMQTLYSRQRQQQQPVRPSKSKRPTTNSTCDGDAEAAPAIAIATTSCGEASLCHDSAQQRAEPNVQSDEASTAPEPPAPQCFAWLERASSTSEQCVLFSAMPSRGGSSSSDANEAVGDNDDEEAAAVAVIADMEALHHLLLRESRDVVSIDFNALDHYSEHIWSLADGVAAYD